MAKKAQTIEEALDDLGAKLSAEIAQPARQALAEGGKYEGRIVILSSGQGYVVTMHSEATLHRKQHKRYIRLK